MGYHIIPDTNISLEDTVYIEKIEQLANISNITKDSIIIRGEQNWKPERIGDSAKYCDYVQDWYRAGIKAQILFKKLAGQHGLILEELNNNQESFMLYTSQSKSIPIKVSVRSLASFDLKI